MQLSLTALQSTRSKHWQGLSFSQGIGAPLAERDCALVYGGGGLGLRGAKAEVALAPAGGVIGGGPTALCLAGGSQLQPAVNHARMGERRTSAPS